MSFSTFVLIKHPGTGLYPCPPHIGSLAVTFDRVKKE